MSDDDEDRNLPPVDHPAYWDLICTLAELYADGHIEVDLEAVTGSVQSVGGNYGPRGIGDLTAMLLARIRLIDDTTPGKDIVTAARERAYTVKFSENRVVDITEEPYQLAAVDQVAPVLADALDLDRCDGRSIAAFLRSTMDSCPPHHYIALVSLAGGMLTRIRRRAAMAVIQPETGRDDSTPD
ncbi:hypothetical protein ACFV42_23835 [Streptomyces solisilvae]|uniref:hypothetical protein n=1 Tax=Streptomyces malaysiensis TaxID=92644 RepID=UPI00369DF2D9